MRSISVVIFFLAMQPSKTKFEESKLKSTVIVSDPVLHIISQNLFVLFN